MTQEEHVKILKEVIDDYKSLIQDYKKICEQLKFELSELKRRNDFLESCLELQFKINEAHVQRFQIITKKFKEV